MFTAHIIAANVHAHPFNSALFCNISISQNQKYITMHLHYIWPCRNHSTFVYKIQAMLMLTNCQGSRKADRANSKCTIHEKPCHMGGYVMSIGEQLPMLGLHLHDQEAQESSFFILLDTEDETLRPFKCS
jgi:hypothetical protein